MSDRVLETVVCQLLAQKHSSSVIHFSNHVLTYGELITFAQKAGVFLQGLGVTPGSRVLLAGTRSISQCIFMLACFFIRVSYVPLRAGCTQEELNLVREATGAFCVLIDDRAVLDGVVYPSLLELEHLPACTVDTKIDLEQEAYVLFTSGTTKKPKAVSITHRQLSTVLASATEYIVIEQTDILSAIHSFCFDFSVWELWYALIHGSGLYIANQNELNNLEDLLSNLVHHRVSLLSVTPSVFYNIGLLQSMNQYDFSHLKQVVLGGETLKKFHFEYWREHNLLYHNLYGATEAAIHATYIQVIPSEFEDQMGSPIGKPLKDYFAKVVDNDLIELPPLCPGELLLRGPAVIDHYLNNSYPEKFVTLNEDGEERRYFRTGDFVHYGTDGQLYFHHRANDHAKIRGFRVDIEMVKEEMEKLDSIAQAHTNIVTIEGQDTLVALIKTVNPYFDGLKKYQDQMPLMALPNGIQIAHQTLAETDFLFKEIFESQQYWNPNVTLPDNPMIVDVGANIGLFTIALKITYPNAIIHCIEPAPEPYKKLSINAELFGPNIVTHCLAIGRRSGPVEMIHYPQMSIMSGSKADYQKNLHWLVLHAKKLKSNVTETISDSELAEALATKLTSCKFVVKQRTLSQFIQTNQIKRIDFLKIDVESSELDVLQSLKKADWELIQNVVIEISLDQESEQFCIELLKMHGFQTQIVQPVDMKAFQLGYLWAWRLSSLPVMRSLEGMNGRSYHLPTYIGNIKAELEDKLPYYAVPKHIVIYHQLPVNRNGKIDFTMALESPREQKNHVFEQVILNGPSIATESFEQVLVDKIRQLFYATLAIDFVAASEQATFFDLGANSLLMIKLYHQLTTKIPECQGLKLVDLFSYPSFKKLAQYICNKNAYVNTKYERAVSLATEHIAIIGLSAIFPGSPDHDAVWQHLCDGDCLIKSYNASELNQFKVESAKIDHPFFVPASGLVEEMYEFDASFFNYTQKDAAYMDPQQRVCLQQTYQALLNAGYAPEHMLGPVGVYVGSGRSNYEHYILSSHTVDKLLDGFAIELLNESDYLAARIAYHYGFTGPAITVNNACATSTTAVIMACDQLRLKKCDVAIAGGVYLKLLNEAGYIAKPESTFSSSGIGSPFSTEADGLVPGSGCGIFVLKRLEQAIQDGDDIKAVIAGYGINNDGGDKIAFSALSLSGQINCIKDALTHAGLTPADIDYVETHGTGTRMGDDLEIRALETVFGERKEKPLYLGASKANFGHADAASGALSLIKIVHMLQENKIPPQIHFDKFNTENNYVFNTSLLQPTTPLKFFAINNFGMGGTNSHIILTKFEGNSSTIFVESDQPNGLFIAAHSQESLFDYAKAFLSTLQTLSPFNKEDWYSIAWLSRRNNLNLPYKAVILADCCINAIAQLKQLLMAQEAGIYAISSTPKERCEIAQKWLQNEDVDLTIFGSLPGRCMPLPSYPFEKTIHQFGVFLNKQNADLSSNHHTTVEKLLAIVKNLTGYNQLDQDQRFFDIGMDSMHALDLITAIQSQFKVKVTLDDFYSYGSIYGFSQYIEELTTRAELSQVKTVKARASIVPLNDKKSSTRILLIPPANGMLYWYRDLVHKLPGTILGVQYDNSDVSRDYDSIVEFALHYCDTLLGKEEKQETVLVGWSLGGNIAYDMGLFLATMNYPIRGLVMIDSYASYQLLENESYYKSNYAEHQTVEGSASWQTLWQRSKMLASAYQPRVNNTVSTCLIRAKTLLPEYEAMASSDNFWGQYIVSEKLTVVECGSDHMSIIRQENSSFLAQVIKMFMPEE